MSNFKKITNDSHLDVFQGYLIQEARRTQPDGYPIIEGWMVEKNIPRYVCQWDQRYSVKDPQHTAISFYCSDHTFMPVLRHPERYIENLRQYQCVIGMDSSPFDNMPLVHQNYQIYNNLRITYFYGKQGIKIIPNVRVGNNSTLKSLDAYPRNHLIAVGTNGFTHEKGNRIIFKEQMSYIVNELRPSGIIVYGPASEFVFEEAIRKQIPLYQYDSYMKIRSQEIAKIRKAVEDEE